MYKLQIVDAGEAQRPEYEDEDNLAWETILAEKTAEELLCAICDWLNDEEYPTNEWVRVVKDNKVLHSGLKIKV